MPDRFSATLNGVRPAALPASRAAFDMRARGAPEPVLPVVPFAWHTAYDTKFMTINSDGTGGQPSIGQPVGRITDRGGGGFHYVQATTANRGIARAGYLALANGGFNNNTRSYASAAAPSGDRRSSSGLLVIDAIQLFQWLAPFAWTNAPATSAAYPTQRCAVVWRANATEFAIWINGVKYSAAALTAGAVGVLNLGAVNSEGRFYENVYYNTALSDPNISALIAYGTARCGSGSLTQNTMWFVGDSITRGFGSENGARVDNYVSYLPSFVRYNTGVNGRLATQLPTGTQVELYRSVGRNYAVVLIGTNDLAGGATPAATEAAIASFCQRIKNSGYRVIVCTLTYRASVVSNANIDSTNALIRANALYNYADALCDLGARTELQNPLNTTYFNDGLHLADGGLQVWANELDSTLKVLDADFQASSLSVLDGQSLSMTDGSIASPTAWNWKVNTVTQSTAQNPTLTFNGTGTKSLVLEVTNNNGTSAKRQRNILVVPLVAPVVANKALWFQKGNVSGATWADTSGNVRNMTLTGSPTINGTGTVTFSGTGQYGKVASFTLNQPVTIYIRVKLISWTNNRSVADGDGGASMLLWMTGTSPQIQAFTASGGATNAGLTLGQWRSLAWGRRNSNVETFVDIGGAFASSSLMQTNNPGGFTIAAQGNGSSPGNIEVAEIIVYNVTHTDAERAQCINYLNGL